MQTLPIYVFKNSFGPILTLLNENSVEYRIRQDRAGVPIASGGVIEILKSPAMWGALATIFIAFLKSRNGRKVTITTKDNKVIHAEGLNPKELEKILEHSKNITAIDPNDPQDDQG